MASYELTMLREKLTLAKQEEFRTRSLHAVALASLNALKAMLAEVEAEENRKVVVVEDEEDEEKPQPKKPLRFSCDQNPKYDQAVDIAAYKIARTNFARNETGLKGEIPWGITFPICTTLKGGGIGVITKQSFEMRVGNYESSLRGGGGGLNSGSRVKVIQYLCKLNPTDEELAEAYAYYSTRTVRE
jgi:hypothetical protein